MALAMVASPVATPAALAATTLTEMALLPGDTSGTANAINDDGVAVGTSSLVLTTHAVRWDTDGTVSALAVWPGDTRSHAHGINADGVIVGDSRNSQRSHAVRWNTDGTITDLGTLPGGLFASAEAVNDSGVAAGYSYDSAFSQRAVRWDADGTITDLGTLPGDSQSYAYGINADGVIVGSSSGPGGLRPVRWNTDGTITQLGTANGAALGISDNGVIVGYTKPTTRETAPTRWNVDGSVTILTPAPGHTSGSVRITADDTVFGSSGPSSTQRHAAIWGADDVATLLGDLSSGGTSAARSVNAGGTVVGWATRDGQTLPVRWDSGPS